jgi:hypothetical protein
MTTPEQHTPEYWNIIDFNVEANQLCEDTVAQVVVSNEPVVLDQISWILRNTTPGSNVATQTYGQIESYISDYYGLPRDWSKKVVRHCEQELTEGGTGG